MSHRTTDFYTAFRTRVLWGSGNLTCRFSQGFKSGDCNRHLRGFQDFFWNQALVDLKVCLRSLTCWKVHWSSRFRFLTDGMIFSLRISWFLIESILQCTSCRFLEPEEAKQHQSIPEQPPYFTSTHLQKFQPCFITEHNHQTSVAYLYSLIIGANFSCAFGSVIVYVLELHSY